MTLIEAEEASEIVNQAAGHGVNIWLGTSIDDSMKDEIRVTVVATGVRQEKIDRVSGVRPVAQQNSYAAGTRENRNSRGSQGYDRNPDLTEHLEVPKPSRQRTEAPQASAFGDWDLRRENIVRSTDASAAPAIERYEDTSSDDDELETPPFFKNR